MDFAVRRDEERFRKALTQSAILHLPPYPGLLLCSCGQGHDVLGLPR